jgi:protein transport protein SEC61 subunit gamma and related proteins
MEEVNVEQQQPKQEPKVEQKAEKPKGPSIAERIKNKLANYKRVVDVARKPNKEEFLSSAKVTGSGIVLLGTVGFIIFILYFLVT